MRFIIGDIELNLHSGVVIKDNCSVNVRAKTLQVLKYLITNQNEIVSKQALLDHVWQDVVVQEQVLVQSIKEIRDLLGSEVIKTYSRQGYQWTAELTPIHTRRQLYTKVSYMLLSVVAITLLAWLVFFATKPEQDVPLKVAFLPVENAMPDDLHAWVPLEGMDYLSQKLMQQSPLQVIESHHLLQAIADSDNYSQLNIDEKIYQVRQKLGPDLIVQTRLMGFPQDFQLYYTLYTPHGVERGVEFAPSVLETFEQLVKNIGARFSEFTPATVPYQSDFSNEAFASGMEYYILRDFHNAIAFFTTAFNANPRLLAARRYLAASFANTGELDRAIDLMLKNIAAANQQGDSREELRGYLMIGYLLINWHQDKQGNRHELHSAEQYLEQGRALAEDYQDQLFIAYTHEELGKIKRLQQDYPQAIRLLKTALGYHKTFSCTYGQTAALIELAKVAIAQGDKAQADDYFQQAHVIADHDGVVTNKVKILQAQAEIAKQAEQVELANQLATKALILAKATKRIPLISRVNAWLRDNALREIN